MDIVMIIILVAALLLLVYLSIRTSRDAPDRAELARLKTRDQDYRDAVRERDEKGRQIELLHTEKATLAADLENERRSATEKLNLLEESEERLKTQFENLANRIFDDKGRALTEQNRERLNGLLQPFREQLESFRNRVDEVHKQGAEQSTRLLEQVRQLQELSGKVSDEANHLAQAIKGDAKTQGDWGELIVERIIEASGLTRDREYSGQTSFRDEAGRLKRPDFVIHLPGKKSVIIDSKVSLTAYERFSREDDPAARQAALDEHVRSVRRHIEELRAKEYGELLGNQTLDFVILCVPLEPAYQAALQADTSLIYDLAQTNVVVTGPTTLMITLKLIAQIWRRENENRNAEIIADRAGRLYDQVALIADAMLDTRKKLGQANDSFELVMRRLQSGRGNLIGRVEELRTLGAKVNKPMPPALAESAMDEITSAPEEEAKATETDEKR